MATGKRVKPKNYDVAKKIVDGIIYDLSDRRGLRHEWDQIDEDIKREIKNEWITIILSHLN